jgi:hypothetical protein
LELLRKVIVRLHVSIGLTLLILPTSVRVEHITLIGVMGVRWPIILCTEFTVFLTLLAANSTMIRALALAIKIICLTKLSKILI